MASKGSGVKLHKGVYFPDHEVHMIEWCDKNGEMIDGKTSYQIKKLRAALSHVRQFRTAIDVGGHVGLWSMHLAKRFETVQAFEPIAEHRDCFVNNLANSSWEATDGNNGRGVALYGCALGNVKALVEMDTPHTSSGGTHVAPGRPGNIPMKLMDDFAFVDVDFIKLDCEGYELLALQGGEQTIRRDMPTIIVEQKPGRAQRFGLAETGAVDWLKGLGYVLAATMSGDYIMTPAG